MRLELFGYHQFQRQISWWHSQGRWGTFWDRQTWKYQRKSMYRRSKESSRLWIQPTYLVEIVFHHEPDRFWQNWSRFQALRVFQTHRSRKDMILRLYKKKKRHTSCCLESNEFSYSFFPRSPTMMLSGTTNDHPSCLLFSLVKFPTSGIFSHSLSVTKDKPHLRTANCCWILDRSARRFANSACSWASLGKTKWWWWWRSSCRVVPLHGITNI